MRDRPLVVLLGIDRATKLRPGERTPARHRLAGRWIDVVDVRKPGRHGVVLLGLEESRVDGR